MSERKSINKHLGDDYFTTDHSKIRKQLKKVSKRNSGQETIRLMTPFSIKCTNCQEYIAKSRKFNAKKETVSNETYLGLKIFRFSIRCPRCNNIIKYKTDPKTADYLIESGAVKNFVNKKNDESEKYKDENIEETLNRLENEEKFNQIKDEKNLKTIEKLEENLLKNELLKNDEFEINNLIKKNRDIDEKNVNNNMKNDDYFEELAKNAFIKKKSNNISNNDNENSKKKISLIGSNTKITKIIRKKRKIII